MNNLEDFVQSNSHRPGRGFREGMQRRRDRAARSGLWTAFILLLVLGGLGAFWWAHIHGRFHKLTAAQEKPEISASAATPGGRELIHLQRIPHADAMEPEFTSALTLPGDGLMLQQANLLLPGAGEVPTLLASKIESLSGPISTIRGAAFSALVQTRQGTHWSDPVEVLAGSAASSQATEMLPDGTRATADFGWPRADGVGGASALKMTASISLTSRGIEAGLIARNVGSSDRAVTLSWQPRFLPPAPGMQRARLLPPLENAAAMRNGERLPPISDTLREIPLDQLRGDRTFVPLRHGYLDPAPEVQLRGDTYTLRLTALTPSIQSLHVSKSDIDSSILLSFSTAGRALNVHERGQPTILHPGETLEWRVRLDALANSGYTPPTP